jgi:RNA polymerase sigma-70 factor (ECF subfamily)
MQQDDTKELVIRAAEGDDTAFSELYKRHAGLVYNMALRSTRSASDAEDVCQEVWLRVHREVGRLRSPELFPLWLRRITSHLCVDAARRKRPSVPLSPVLETNTTGPEAAIARKEEASLAWQALGALTPLQSVALFLRDVEGYDYDRISRTLDTSVSGVGTLLFRARRSLARSYESLSASKPERCRQARQVMAAVIDGEGSPVQMRSLRAHLNDCPTCQQEIEAMRRASEAIAALPLLPAIGLQLVNVAQVSTGVGGLGVLARLAALLAKAPTPLVPALVATNAALTVVTLPAVLPDGRNEPIEASRPPAEVREAPASTLIEAGRLTVEPVGPAQAFQAVQAEEGATSAPREEESGAGPPTVESPPAVFQAPVPLPATGLPSAPPVSTQVTELPPVTPILTEVLTPVTEPLVSQLDEVIEALPTIELPGLTADLSRGEVTVAPAEAIETVRGTTQEATDRIEDVTGVPVQELPVVSPVVSAVDRLLSSDPDADAAPAPDREIRIDLPLLP